MQRSTCTLSHERSGVRSLSQWEREEDFGTIVAVKGGVILGIVIVIVLIVFVIFLVIVMLIFVIVVLVVDLVPSDLAFPAP